MVLLPSAAGARLGQGQARQASVRASLRLSHRMAALHRHARARAGPTRRRSASGSIKAFADILDAPGGLLLVERRRRRDRPPPRRGTGRARNPPPSELGDRRRLLARGRSRRPDHRVRRAAAAAGATPSDCAARHSRTGCSPNASAWAGVPLIHDDRLVGLVLLAAPDYRRALDWEDFDLLRTAGRQAATLAGRGAWPGGAVERAAVRGIQPPLRLHPPRHQESRQPVVAASRATPSATPTIPSSAPTWSRRCKSSVGKMNDLLARLAPQAPSARRSEPSRSRCARSSPRRSPPSAATTRSGCSATPACGSMADAAGARAGGRPPPPECGRRQPAGRAGHRPRRRATATRSRIAIADQGSGMDGDFVRNRLFQPFASTKPGGFGIGVVRGALADRRDGRPPHRRQPARARAATFTISLPAAEPAARTETENRMTDQTELPVLLIVEDDEGLQRQLKWAYEGYRVVVRRRPRRRRSSCCACTSRRWSRSTSACRPIPTAPARASPR